MLLIANDVAASEYAWGGQEVRALMSRLDANGLGHLLATAGQIEAIARVPKAWVVKEESNGMF